jgi:hypothetical protein
MILAVLGAILIIAGVAIVVRKTAETWLQRRAGRLDEIGEKPQISYHAIVLIGLGALLVAISTSGSPPPKP